MDEFLTDHILSSMADEITAQGDLTPMPLSGDKWLMSSVWQKSVRRGDVDTALRAALSYWAKDQKGMWRRLHVTALEDIGAGDIETVVKVLLATSSPYWRKRVGDLRVALYLTRLMCLSVKNRMGDELIIQAEHAPEFKSVREQLSGAHHRHLLDVIENERAPLVERALSVWLLCGTQKYGSEVLPTVEGNPDLCMEALRGLSVPKALTEASLSVMNKTSWPLAVFMPLIWQDVQKDKAELTVTENTLPVLPALDGIPVYGVDMFTRTGQSAIRQFIKAVPDLRTYSVKQIGLVLFYLEGGQVNRLLTSPRLEEFKRNGEFADILSSGLCIPEYLGLKECVENNMDLLHDLRVRSVRNLLEREAA